MRFPGTCTLVCDQVAGADTSSLSDMAENHMIVILPLCGMKLGPHDDAALGLLKTVFPAGHEAWKGPP